MNRTRIMLLAFGAVWLALFAKSLEFEPPYFRPWEMLIAPEKNFVPNARVEMTEIGDLGRRAWVRSLQAPRDTVFTTDSFGYRNAQEIERPRIVIAGDSFVVGSGLSDAETISAQLSAVLGEPVYNFGTQNIDGVSAALVYFLQDPRFREHPPQYVVWMPPSRVIFPIPIGGARPKTEASSEETQVIAMPALLAAIGARIEGARAVIDRDNGLDHFAKYVFHETAFLLGDRPLMLEQGGLVLSIEEQLLDRSPEERELAEVVRTVELARKALAQRGTTLIFCPVPEPGIIYADRYPQAERAKIHPRSFFGELLAATNGIDLRPIYEKNRDPYLFLPDDTHWSARATRLAAEALQPSM